MIHYKIAQSVVDGLTTTFCGKQTDDPEMKDSDFRHIPPCDPGCKRLIVTCPDCLKVMKEITKFISEFGE